MTITSRLAAAAALASLLATAACVTDPATGERHVNKTAIGALAGAALGTGTGALVGGHHNRTEMIVGAGIGALAGGAVGNYMDRQERKLREQTAGTGVQVVRQGNDIVLNMPSGITFATNSYALNPQVQGTLDQVAATLAQYNQTYLDVYGHTDPTGTPAINGPLSQNRARAVAEYLEAHGVARARMGVQGFGATRPVAANDTADGRAQNRRVEIKIVPLTQGDVRNPA